MVRGHHSRASPYRVWEDVKSQLWKARLWAWQHPTHATRYTSRSSNNKLVPSHDIANNNRGGMKCNYCKRVGLLLHDCNTLKAKECRYARKEWVKHIHLQHKAWTLPRKHRSEGNTRGQGIIEGSNGARCTSQLDTVTQSFDIATRPTGRTVIVPITLVTLSTSAYRRHIRATTSNVRVFSSLQLKMRLAV